VQPLEDAQRKRGAADPAPRQGEPDEALAGRRILHVEALSSLADLVVAQLRVEHVAELDGLGILRRTYLLPKAARRFSGPL